MFKISALILAGYSLGLLIVTCSNAYGQNATVTSTRSNFDNLHERYISSLEQLGFSSVSNNFIMPYSGRGYGIYQIKPSNIFKPGDTISIYLEPIGFSFKKEIDEQGNPLNTINLTADAEILNENGTSIFSSKDLSTERISSYNKNTDVYMIIDLAQSEPLPLGNYKIIYKITDGTSNKSFNMTKDIKIANVEEVS